VVLLLEVNDAHNVNAEKKHNALHESIVVMTKSGLHLVNGREVFNLFVLIVVVQMI
jgi:hypothetical protein